MLESLPKKYLLGLVEVVLTNSSALSRKRRRSVTTSRRRKVRVIEAAGLYHPAFKGKLAWIEIFVDTTLRGWEKGLWLRIPLIREGKLEDILFHEIGHHIHFTCRPEYRETEDAADTWKVRLGRQYNLRRFRWMARFGDLIRPLRGSFIDRQRSEDRETNAPRGQISRAEYEETVRRNRPGEHQSQNNAQITGIVDGTRQQPTAGQEPVLEGWSTIEVDVRLSYCPSRNIIPCFDADEKRLPLPSHL